MLIFTNERCQRAPRSARRGSLPFNPGELYLVRYMGQPTLVTVQSVKDGMVTTWSATETLEQFNDRVICRLGQRPSFLGMFMPWVRLDPTRHLHLDVSEALGTNSSFWNVTRALPQS
jgi:hypothetical protein